MTSLLSLTALRLRDRNVLIKRSDIIENLGVATIIASDKTGTLTQNRMTVQNVWTNLVCVNAGWFCAWRVPPQCQSQHWAACAPLAWQSAASHSQTSAAHASQELHSGSDFQPPPQAPQASLDRASTLAKASLARRSRLAGALAKSGWWWGLWVPRTVCCCQSILAPQHASQA